MHVNDMPAADRIESGDQILLDRLLQLWPPLPSPAVPAAIGRS